MIVRPALKIQTYSALLLVLALGAFHGPARAGEADVVAVTVVASAAGVYRFDVTLSHADEGWHHYADKWEIRDGDGTVLATRVLAHPHVNEQPFTRRLSGVRIGPNLNVVTVAAHDSVHGYGGEEITVDLPE